MKYERIKKNTDIQRLFRRGTRAFSRSLTVLYAPSESLKMAVIVSKKHGKAVKRNRIKRLLRQAFYNTCNLLEFPACVVLMPKVAEEYSLAEFEKSLKSCFKKMLCTRA